ncbi:hypothetical protein Tco_0022075, partial [Tanacetum coccineum]
PFLTSCSAYTARSCDRVILPLEILSESRVTTLCCSNNPTLARRVIVFCMADAKLAHRVFMSSLIDSICYGGGGGAAGGSDGSGDSDTHGSSDGEGDLNLLRDEDGKSDVVVKMMMAKVMVVMMMMVSLMEIVDDRWM